MDIIMAGFVIILIGMAISLIAIWRKSVVKVHAKVSIKKGTNEDVFILTKQVMKQVRNNSLPNADIEIRIIGVFKSQEECYNQYIKCVNSKDVKYGLIHMKEDGTHIGLMIDEPETIIAKVHIDQYKSYSVLEDDMDF